MNHPDQEILELLKQDGEQAIELLFKKYYNFICRALIRILKDENLSEDLAQDVFFELWRKRDRLNITTSVKAYLRRAAVNKALNYIRDQKIKWDDNESNPQLESNLTGSHQKLETAELQIRIDAAIDALPERCRLVFTLSRFEEMTYQQIADHLGISIKTVENQISKALKTLRVSLGDFL